MKTIVWMDYKSFHQTLREMNCFADWSNRINLGNNQFKGILANSDTKNPVSGVIVKVDPSNPFGCKNCLYTIISL